jgi:hypothetical protein
MFTVSEMESTEHWPKGRKRRKGNCEKREAKTYQVPIPQKVQFKLYMICLFME